LDENEIKSTPSEPPQLPQPSRLQRLKDFFCSNWRLIVTWLIIISVIVVGLLLHIDKGILVVIVFVFGLLAQAFTGLVALIATVPIVGPLIAKVLTLPIFWILNGLGYFVSVVAIKKGYGKDVINYRFVTIIFLIGFAVGFILAKII